MLHTLFTRTGAFQNYIAGSPSMWWGEGVPASEAKRFAMHNAGHTVSAAVHVGEREQSTESRAQRNASNPRVKAMLALRQSVPPDSAKPLVEDLQDVPNLQISYREFPELGHGEMFRASLEAGLRAADKFADTFPLTHSTPTHDPFEHSTTASQRATADRRDRPR